MARLFSVVRIVARQSATWRSCAGCEEFFPLAADVTHCPACLSALARAVRRRAA